MRGRLFIDDVDGGTAGHVGARIWWAGLGLLRAFAAAVLRIGRRVVIIV